VYLGAVNKDFVAFCRPIPGTGKSTTVKQMYRLTTMWQRSLRSRNKVKVTDSSNVVGNDEGINSIELLNPNESARTTVSTQATQVRPTRSMRRDLTSVEDKNVSVNATNHSDDKDNNENAVALARSSNRRKKRDKMVNIESDQMEVSHKRRKKDTIAPDQIKSEFPDIVHSIVPVPVPSTVKSEFVADYVPSAVHSSVPDDVHSTEIIAFTGTKRGRSSNSGRRSIHQINVKTGKIIKTFSSLSETGQSIGISQRILTSILRGTYKTKDYKGWTFRYADQDDENNKIRSRRNVQVKVEVKQEVDVANNVDETDVTHKKQRKNLGITSKVKGSRKRVKNIVASRGSEEYTFPSFTLASNKTLVPRKQISDMLRGNLDSFNGWTFNLVSNDTSQSDALSLPQPTETVSSSSIQIKPEPIYSFSERSPDPVVSTSVHVKSEPPATLVPKAVISHDSITMNNASVNTLATKKPSPASTNGKLKSLSATVTRRNSKMEISVEEYDSKTGKMLQTYRSLALASEKLGIDENIISAVIAGKVPNCSGLKWKYSTSQPKIHDKEALSKSIEQTDESEKCNPSLDDVEYPYDIEEGAPEDTPNDEPLMKDMGSKMAETTANNFSPQVATTSSVELKSNAPKVLKKRSRSSKTEKSISSKLQDKITAQLSEHKNTNLISSTLKKAPSVAAIDIDRIADIIQIVPGKSQRFSVVRIDIKDMGIPDIESYEKRAPRMALSILNIKVKKNRPQSFYVKSLTGKRTYGIQTGDYLFVSNVQPIEGGTTNISLVASEEVKKVLGGKFRPITILAVRPIISSRLIRPTLKQSVEKKVDIDDLPNENSNNVRNKKIKGVMNALNLVVSKIFEDIVSPVKYKWYKESKSFEFFKVTIYQKGALGMLVSKCVAPKEVIEKMHFLVREGDGKNLRVENLIGTSSIARTLGIQSGDYLFEERLSGSWYRCETIHFGSYDCILYALEREYRPITLIIARMKSNAADTLLANETRQALISTTFLPNDVPPSLANSKAHGVKKKQKIDDTVKEVIFDESTDEESEDYTVHRIVIKEVGKLGIHAKRVKAPENVLSLLDIEYASDSGKGINLQVDSLIDELSSARTCGIHAGDFLFVPKTQPFVRHVFDLEPINDSYDSIVEVLQCDFRPVTLIAVRLKSPSKLKSSIVTKQKNMVPAKSLAQKQASDNNARNKPTLDQEALTILCRELPIPTNSIWKEDVKRNKQLSINNRKPAIPGTKCLRTKRSKNIVNDTKSSAVIANFDSSAKVTRKGNDVTIGKKVVSDAKSSQTKSTFDPNADVAIDEFDFSSGKNESIKIVSDILSSSAIATFDPSAVVAIEEYDVSTGKLMNTYSSLTAMEEDNRIPLYKSRYSIIDTMKSPPHYARKVKWQFSLPQALLPGTGSDVNDTINAKGQRHNGSASPDNLDIQNENSRKIPLESMTVSSSNNQEDYKCRDLPIINPIKFGELELYVLYKVTIYEKGPLGLIVNESDAPKDDDADDDADDLLPCPDYNAGFGYRNLRVKKLIGKSGIAYRHGIQAGDYLLQEIKRHSHLWCMGWGPNEYYENEYEDILYALEKEYRPITLIIARLKSETSEAEMMASQSRHLSESARTTAKAKGYDYEVSFIPSSDDESDDYSVHRIIIKDKGILGISAKLVQAPKEVLSRIDFYNSNKRSECKHLQVDSLVSESCVAQSHGIKAGDYLFAPRFQQYSRKLVDYGIDDNDYHDIIELFDREDSRPFTLLAVRLKSPSIVTRKKKSDDSVVEQRFFK
jgi:hypothetical protein